MSEPGLEYGSMKKESDKMVEPTPEHAIVLLSGGFDSTAALYWAKKKWKDKVSAILFDYGQVNRNAELPAAGRTCKDLGVPHTMLHIGEAVRGLSALTPPKRGMGSGPNRFVSNANLPARNSIFLTTAAAHAAGQFPEHLIHLVVGSNFDDQKGFPDCRRPFFDAAEVAINAAIERIAKVKIHSPWVKFPKYEILKWAMVREKRTPGILAALERSVSCYRGTRCDKCDACYFRKVAYDAQELADPRLPVPGMTGGDPSREKR